jgi:hypothetical protein
VDGKNAVEEEMVLFVGEADMGDGFWGEVESGDG